MNEQERAELEALKERQSELLRQMTELAEQLRGKELLLEGARRDLQQLRTTQATLEQSRVRLAREIVQFDSRVSMPKAAPVAPPPIPASAQQAAVTSRIQEPAAIPAPPPIIPAAPPVIPQETRPVVPEVLPLESI